MANVGYLQAQAKDRPDKIHLVYNSLTLRPDGQSLVEMHPPIQAFGRGPLRAHQGLRRPAAGLRHPEEPGIPFRLTLVGSGFQETKLRLMRKTLCLEDHVDMPGFLSHDRMAELLNTQDMLVVPSVVHTSGDRDGIPNVIMEAMSHRLPVVATDVCGIPEVVRHGQTGFIVPQRDPAALAGAIRAMSGDRTNGPWDMARAGQELVVGMFDPETNARKLFDLFLSQLTAQVPGGVTPCAASPG